MFPIFSYFANLTMLIFKLFLASCFLTFPFTIFSVMFKNFLIFLSFLVFSISRVLNRDSKAVSIVRTAVRTFGFPHNTLLKLKTYELFVVYKI